jgi:hypothetical protein
VIGVGTVCGSRLLQPRALGPIAHITGFRGLLTDARLGIHASVRADKVARRQYVNSADRARMRLAMRLIPLGHLDPCVTTALATVRRG